ncbi:bifunctional protein-serine/threonine kinase/phosphatase [Salipiger mangrovisoli]|uniref:Bifunctional protein-serine/threonine kinase/phosphatase n=1 Tax=Salipiger mangrovisoli TaxID=2865933 RepID=A0ABR9X2Z3_9RHOB|nr:bifunctional protein-serine/threonine kinase/phosphatase [Salipiger mangrovisoli]MBE9637889.1 bifunctional protein-serine/threonine kinase/phosphatase [Salipiger mangrovisoli]
MTQSTAPGLRLSIGQHARQGMKPQMQDFHGALLPEGTQLALKGAVVALADGISTSPHARAAAEMAVGALVTDYYDTPESWTVQTAAGRVIAATNAWLHGQSRAVAPGDPDRGFVCTLSAIVLKGREAHLFHVGDSRISRLAGDSLEPLTEDHVSGGMLSRAMGVAAELRLDHRRITLHAGDVFLLTTDGVHAHVTGRDLHAALARSTDLDAVAEHLVGLALQRGSRDNLTAQVLRIDALPTPGSAALGDEAAVLPVPPLPKPGQEIDGFRILRPLHHSARSHVFLAATPSGSKVALKIPASEIVEDPEARRRFLLEDWVARRIDSPHVLRAAPLPGPRSALYGVTEYVEAITLRQWMTDHPKPSLDEVRGIVTQVADGLRAIHRREMIHQDIRPENLLIDAGGTVRILDFGSVAVAGVEEATPGLMGAMPGTYQYTAPEYLSGDVVSWRSDMFALAVIAYEMLTGLLPYGTQVARIASRRDQMRLAYRSACDDKSAVPLWMDEALQRALHPDPVRRPDALSEFLASLRRPSPGWQAAHRRPLAARNPVRFWQAVSALLAALCLFLAAQLGG